LIHFYKREVGVTITMWSSSQGGGGGFFNSTQSSPSAQGTGSGAKAKRAQNVVPVLINQVLTAAEEGFSIEGVEVGMVEIVGKVLGIENAATKTSYQIEDSTGVVDVIEYVGESGQDQEHFEGSHVKVVGSIRTQGEKKHVMAFKIIDVPTEAERDFHILNVCCSQLKLKQLHQKQMGGGGGGGMDQSGLSNSMMGGGLGGGASNLGGGASATASFGNRTHDLVYNHILQCKEDQGLNITNLYNQIRNQISKAEMDSAIDFLSCEGHIYSTVDDEHYKPTDGD